MVISLAGLNEYTNSMDYWIQTPFSTMYFNQRDKNLQKRISFPVILIVIHTNGQTSFIDHFCDDGPYIIGYDLLSIGSRVYPVRLIQLGISGHIL